MKKVILTILMITLSAPALVSASSSGEDVYQKACAMCHKSGLAGAPVTGDKEAWAPRIAEGKELLYKNSINGIGAMPAKGGHATLTDDEVKAAVDYMIEASQ